jgi:hypothetical protein
MEKVETSFVAYKFTAEELKAVRMISPEHKMYLQTLLADAAESKLNLTLDPYKPLLFTQQEAYIRGQMDILSMLLSEDSVSRPKNAITQPEKE